MTIHSFSLPSTPSSLLCLRLFFSLQAQSAECKGLYELQASYLLKARQWDRAHQVVIGHVAPEAIVSSNLALFVL